MEDAGIDIFYADVYDEEGKGPEQVGDYEAVKTGLQFFNIMEVILCLIEEEIA